MDYDHVWTNSAGNLSLTFGNNCLQAPSFCPEPYPRRNGLFVNTPSRHTPKCSRFRNLSSEPCPSSILNHNVRYHPYQPLVTSFQETDHRRPKTCHGGPYGPESEEKFLCCPQKMHPNTGKANCSGINNHFKSNERRKLPKTKIKGNSSALNTDNNRQVNYAVSAIDNNRQANYAVSAIDNNRQANYAVSAIDNNRQANYAFNTIDNNCQTNYAFSAIDNNCQTNYAVNAIDNNCQTNYAVSAIDNNRQANYAFSAIDNNGQANYAVSAIDNNRQANYAVSAIDNNRQANYAVSVIDNNNQSNYAINTIDNNQTNSTANATVHFIPNKEVLVKIKDENSCSKLPITNEQNYTHGKDSYGDTIKANINNTGSSLNYANEIQNKNLTAKNIGLIPEYQNDPLQNNVTNASEDNKDLVFADSMTKADISSLQAMNNLDLSGCQITHLSIPENISSNTHDIQNEISELTDIESSFFKSIFEGKDENGDDIVVLLADSGMQEMVNSEINTDTFAYNENLKTGINRGDALNFTGDNMATDQTSSEFHFEMQQSKQDDPLNSTGDNVVTIRASTESHFDTQQIKQKPNDHSEDMFFSRIDDHVSEETVITSKTPKSKKKKKKSETNTERSQETNVKQTAVENNATSACASEPSTSRDNEETSTNTAQNVNSSDKKLNFNKRNRQWKSNEALRNIQHEYFEKILKRVKMENKHLMEDKRFWDMYQIIVNRVGESAMGTMYNMLPALIENYGASEQKTNSIASKANKKRLRVKLPMKPKKRKDSEN